MTCPVDRRRLAFTSAKSLKSSLSKAPVATAFIRSAPSPPSAKTSSATALYAMYAASAAFSASSSEAKSGVLVGLGAGVTGGSEPTHPVSTRTERNTTAIRMPVRYGNPRDGPRSSPQGASPDHEGQTSAAQRTGEGSKVALRGRWKGYAARALRGRGSERLNAVPTPSSLSTSSSPSCAVTIAFVIVSPRPTPGTALRVAVDALKNRA